jgi:hypothetical protein
MRYRVIIATLLLALGSATAGYASSTGIASTVFGATGCPLCHGGGLAPDVVLSGPTSVMPGTANDYTLTIFSNPAQNYGGLNVAAAIGTLATGGPFAMGTKTVTGALGLDEVTHTAPKQGDIMNIIEFSFRWTAPVTFSAVTLRGWGNAVNLSQSPLGDAAALATLDVVNALLDTATPSASPTPTPTAPPCGDSAPLHPPLLTDPAAAACQAAVAKVGAGYLKKDLKAVRSCLNDFQSNAAGGDPIALCVGSAGVGPADAKAAIDISKAQGRARAQLQGKCSDSAVAALDLCAETESAFATCFLAEHRQHVIDLISNQYGVVAPSADKDDRKCQKAIGRAAAGYVLAHLRASQKCLVKRNKSGSAVDGAAQCVGALVGNAFVAPLDPKVADAIASAASKLGYAVQGKCTAETLAALDGCGADPASAVTCLLCTHRSTTFALISDQFGGLP